MPRRKPYQVALVLLALFLLGTVLVLSSVSFYLRINPAAYLSEQEIIDDNASNRSLLIPRILHQTWKTDVLPDHWQAVIQRCRVLMPDYEYMLWTDASSRAFISDNYPWFLSTYDAYTYPIQRADAIRYFVLHKYGGVYLDLDVGCTKSVDPLLIYPVVLPKTIPVGISNDVMFAQPNHPFMEQTIHNLITFDHSWLLNYPTVMFSTGPMFLSAQYGLYASRPGQQDQVRILPKSLYGKNAKPDEAPHSFFTHYYGSSWHADDAGFITFLGKWGKLLMWFGLAVLVVGMIRLAWTRNSKPSSSVRRRLLIGRYDIILPRVSHRNGHFNFDLGSFSLSATTSSAGTQPSSPNSASPTFSNPSSPVSSDPGMPLLPMFDSDASVTDTNESQSPVTVATSSAAAQALRSASAWVHSLSGEASGSRNRSRRGRAAGENRRTLFFLPAIFTPTSSNTTVRLHDEDQLDVPFLKTPSPSSRRGDLKREVDPEEYDIPQFPEGDEQDIALHVPSTSSRSRSSTSRLPIISPPLLDLSPSTIPAPPPYDDTRHSPHILPLHSPSGRQRLRSPQSAWSSAWGEWEGDQAPPTP